MQVSKDMAGFTGGQADTLRKAMGKKIAKLMKEMREKFIDGSVGNGVERPTAEKIFQQFEEFAAYGFNKSHAACYALISYQTAYLKAHYPACFMAALMNSDISNIDRITIEVEECRRMGMNVLPPDVNESFPGFGVIKQTLATDSPTIRFGLQAIKGMGSDLADAIVKERKANGSFTDVSDFARRLPGRAFNKKSLEVLVKSGSLDRFGERNALLYNLDNMLEYHRAMGNEASSGQVNLFGGQSEEKQQVNLRAAPPAAKRDLLQWERELLGLYVSEHPFKETDAKLHGFFTSVTELKNHSRAKNIRIGGVISDAKKIYTKNNESMLFAKLEDLSGSVEVVVFPRVFRDKPEAWEIDNVVCLTGRAQEKDGEMKFLAETCYVITLENIDEVKRYVESGGSNSVQTEEAAPPQEERSAVTLHLRTHLPDTILHRLRECCDKRPGPHQVYFKIDDERGPRIIKSSYTIAFDDEITRELESMLGPDTVRAGSAHI